MRLKRSHYCGGLNSSNEKEEVILSGWVDRWRDHGGVVFIDLRDREGITQIVFDPNASILSEASLLRQEYVISVKGKVRLRPKGMENKNIPTGEIEVVASDLEILNTSEPLPYSIHEDSPSQGEVDESLRLEHRYLELRRPALQKNLNIRHLFLKSARDFYFENKFLEIETPILYKSTPEGARDYLVPSRVHPGSFYALPQSPQTLKQLCMIGGLDRYVQIARCFRDEDLRADRQPEFTQIDVEMSFVSERDVMTLHEKLIKKVFKDVLTTDIEIPFKVLTHCDAMNLYGSDKPDLRNSLKLVDLTDEGKKSEFQVYKTMLANGGILKGLCLEEKTPLSRSELDELPNMVKPFGAQGITWIRIKEPGNWQSPQSKFFNASLKSEIEEKLPFKNPAILLLMCGTAKVVNNSLSFLRDEFGDRFGYIDKSKRAFAWITEFPLLEYSEEDKRFYAAHHPFTSPHADDLSSFMSHNDIAYLKKVRAKAYDLVLDGFEIGGGSLRIYDAKLQARMFEVLGISPEEAKVKFGFFLKALQYGTPPHGGIALGVDRISMLLSGANAIRDVIAFPKTQKASDLMAEAPTPVPDALLKELSLKIIKS